MKGFESRNILSTVQEIDNSYLYSPSAGCSEKFTKIPSTHKSRRGAQRQEKSCQSPLGASAECPETTPIENNQKAIPKNTTIMSRMFDFLLNW